MQEKFTIDLIFFASYDILFLKENYSMIDCIIIGSGPAGISAALTLQSNRKSFLLFGGNHLSEKVEKAEKIHNYPGLSDVSGKDLKCNFIFIGTISDV